MLDNLSFNIKPKDKVLIVGPSGAGKTTLLNCIAKNLSSYQGTIRMDGIDLQEIDNVSFLKQCGYIRQNHFLFKDSIKNNIILLSAYDENKFNQIIKQVDLLEWMTQLDEQENHLLKQVGANISGGQRQRISIARELYHDRDVLFVDEPSASLDDETSQKLYDTLLSLDKTVVLVSHRHLEYLKERVDQVIELKQAGKKQ